MFFKALPLIENTDSPSARDGFKASIVPRTILTESNVFESFPVENVGKSRQKVVTEHNHLEEDQKKKITGLDHTVETLMKMFEKLKQKSTECEKKKVQKPKVQSSPKFTWVESQKLKPNIARNLALFGKPFHMKVPTQPPKLPVIKIWKPLSSTAKSSWKPMLGVSGWME